MTIFQFLEHCDEVPIFLVLESFFFSLRFLFIQRKDKNWLTNWQNSWCLQRDALSTRKVNFMLRFFRLRFLHFLKGMLADADLDFRSCWWTPFQFTCACLYIICCPGVMSYKFKEFWAMRIYIRLFSWFITILLIIWAVYLKWASLVQW